MQDSQGHAVPAPGLARVALRERQVAARGLATQAQRIGEGRRDSRRAARMVVVTVADHEHVEPVETDRVQGRQHRRIAEIETGRIARPRVVQQRMVAGPDQHRESLADIDDTRLETAIGGSWQMRTQQRQEQDQTERARRDRARQEQPDGAEQRGQHGPRRRARKIPVRARPGRHALEQPPLRMHDPSGRDQQRRGQRRNGQQQQGAEQRERHDDETDQRHGDEVRQRADQRGLAEEPRGQRQQRHRHQDLAETEFAQPTEHATGPREAQHEDRDADEGQPEPGRQHRERVEREDRDQRKRQRLRAADRPASEPREHDHRDHDQGTHGRQAATGEKPVPDRDEQRSRRFGDSRGDAQCERGAQPPQRTDHEHAERGRDADMEARDRDQVRDAVRARDIPVMLVKPARIADRECLQQVCIVRIGDPRGDAARDRGAQPIDTCTTTEPSIVAVVAHVAGRDDATLEREPLEVETTRIDDAAWPLEAQAQLPAPAWIGQRLAQVVPGDAHATAQRQFDAVERRAFDAQRETPCVDAASRQLVEYADDVEVAAFQRARQACVERRIRSPCTPRETDQHERREAPARPAPKEQPRREHAHARQPDRRQARQALHREHAEQQADGGGRDETRTSLTTDLRTCLAHSVATLPVSPSGSTTPSIAGTDRGNRLPP